MRDHGGVPIAAFKGLFDRGEDDPVPLDHFIDCLNVKYSQNAVETREGTTLSITRAGIKRIHLYKRTGEASRLLILVSGGNLYDSTNMSSPILTVGAATDFSVVNFFNRAYITPHDGQKGIPGEFVYVYDGSGTARKIGSVAPSGTLVAANSSNSGYVEAGTHLFAVAYETASGYISKPGPALFTALACPGEKKVDLSGIPVGPAYVTKRHILATKAIQDYDGNQNAHEFFFVPNGTISNNTATTLTVDFFDADLVDTAEYLFDQATELAAGVGIAQYQSRMVVWGGPDGSLVRISKAGDPESFDELDGFLVVDPTEAGSVRSAIEFRNALYLFKGLRSYVTQDPQTGIEPASWEVVTLDRGTGTEVYGVSQLLDARGSNSDKFILADRSGLILFDGLFQRPELSWKIREVWARVNPLYFYTIQVLQDPVKQRVYVNLPLDAATEPSHVLLGDYSDGMDMLNIKWSLWQFPYKPTSIVVDTDANNRTFLRIGSSEGNVYSTSASATNDNNIAIDSYFKTALVTPAQSGEVCHFTGVRMRVSGSGNLQLTLSGEDDADPETLPQIVLAASPKREEIALANLINEKASLKVRTSFINERFKVTRVLVFSKILWMSRPY